ncbi:MAG: UDP-N-acetylmuramoyl-L-alanine--D-glutamate ligase [Anaerolineae bacterium]
MGESKKVSVIGLGREGMALARFLAQRGATVTVSDIKTRKELAERIEGLSEFPIRFKLGSHPQSLLDADVIYVSPGVPQDIPLLVEARKRGIPISSETRLFFSLCPAPVIGITGSSGKGTTATLVAQILQAAGRQTYVGENIGFPLIKKVEEIDPEAIVVAELSSFQLEVLDRSPHIASILNIRPNHLDRHKSMEAYTAAKLNILRYQTADDWAILNKDDPLTSQFIDRCKGGVLLFSRKEVVEGAFIRGDKVFIHWGGGEEEVCHKKDVQLFGEHNLENILAACAISAAAGAPPEAMTSACTTFKGLEHRLEFLRELNGVFYYNDSLATSPDRTVAALEAFDKPIVLLGGGRNKGLPLKGLADLIVQKVRYLVLFGEQAILLEEAVRKAQSRKGTMGVPIIKRAGDDLEKAVRLAAEASRPGDVVLFSPAGTSYDMYCDFAERGEHFKDLVGKLKDG